MKLKSILLQLAHQAMQVYDLPNMAIYWIAGKVKSVSVDSQLIRCAESIGINM